MAAAEHNELISIIVPVYNCERFLDQCIESIIGQTYRNIEAILIDDGSTDSSPSICDRFSARDSRVRVFHIDNEGASAARNTGIEKASGDYIVFCDSDDWLELNAIERMHGVMTKYNTDLVLAGYTKYSERMQFNLSNHRLSKTWLAIMEDRKNIAMLFSNTRTSLAGVSIWAKMYRASIIRDNGVRFPEDINYEEDCVFNTRYYRYAGSAIALPDILYHYRQTDDGLSKNYSIDGFKFLLNGLSERQKLYKEIGLQDKLDLLDNVFVTGSTSR